MRYVGFVAPMLFLIAFAIPVFAISSDSNNLNLKTSSSTLQQFDKIFNSKSKDASVFVASESQREKLFKQIDEVLSIEGNVKVIVWIKEGYSSEDIIRSLRGFEVKYIYDELNGFSGSANSLAINQLKSNKGVNYVVVDSKVVANLLQSRPLIRANLVESNYGLNGQGIGVCHLDTGVNYNHANLAGAYAGGYDFVNNDADPFDDNGHGTSTAGVLASNHSSFRGIAPGIDLLELKVLDANGNGFFSDVAAGINWCISNKNNYNIAAVSMSLGTDQTYDRSNSPLTIEPALNILYNNHISPVASTGNTGSITGVSYPAVSPFVISVASSYNSNLGTLTFNSGNFSCTDSGIIPNMMACFSNRASFVDLVAPGSNILSTSIGGNFAPKAGTSMAAPHVSGVIALMKQRNSQMTVPQVRNILKSTGVQIYDPASGYNFSRIDALSAVDSVPYLTRNGSFVPGGHVDLHISDAMHPGNVYFVFESFSDVNSGTSFGIPLPNGLIFPLGFDGLLTFSLTYPNPLVTNNIGLLDSNGRATATFNVPNLPGIENFTIYSAVLTSNATDIDTITNSVRV